MKAGAAIEQERNGGVSSAALVLMDFQAALVERMGGQAAASAARRLREKCQAMGMLTVLVRVGYRPDYLDVSQQNRVCAGIVSSGRLIEGSQSAEFHPDLGVAGDGSDVIVTKKRVGAFQGTDLEVILRSRNITTLVLAGLTTSGAVLSTLRDAADRDYHLFVLRDCCVDGDSSVQNMLMESLFPRQATVCTSDEVLKLLAEGAAAE